MSSQTAPFKSFYFEGNLAWGTIDSLDKWRRVLNSYSEANPKQNSEELMMSAHATIESEAVENGKKPPYKPYLMNFGLYGEHHSSLTLQSWAKKNGMYDILLNA